MRTTALLAAIIGTTCLLIASSAAADECKLVKVASFRLTRSDNDTPAVDVEIGGKSRPFAISTGATVSFIPEFVAKTASYKPVTLPGAYIANQWLEKGASIPTLKIGGLTATDQVFYMMPGRSVGGWSGELGLDKLEGYDIELDLAHDVLNLFDKNHCRGHVVYWTDSAAAIPIDIQPDGQINVPMELDGKPVNVLFDTLQPSAEMTFATAHRLFDVHRTDLRASSDEEAGDFRRDFHTLSVGGLVFSNPDIAIDDYGDKEAVCDGKFHYIEKAHHEMVPYRCYGGGDMRLGLKQLHALRIFIAFSEKVIYVTPADAH